MRNAFAYVLDTLAKIGSSKSSLISSVTLEKPGLVANSALRPADVYVTLKSDKEVLDCDGQSLPVTSIAFDITYATIPDNPGCDGLKNTSSFSPAAFPHLVSAENKKRTDTHDGRTPGGTAVYLANQSVAFIPLAMDYLGGMGASMSLVLHNTLTGRRPDRGTQDKISKIPAADLAAVRWVTPKQVASEDPKQYLPPFHPASINGQLKAASEQLKRESKSSDEHDAWLVHTDFRKLAMALSTCHAHGVAQVAEIFVSSRSAAKGISACLPSLSDGKPYVEKEVSKAVQFLKNLPCEDDLLSPSLGTLLHDQLSPGEDSFASGEEDDLGICTREDVTASCPSTPPHTTHELGGGMAMDCDDKASPNDLEKDATHNSTPSRRLLASGIGIISPQSGMEAAHALRRLLQNSSVPEEALQQLFTEHGIRVQTARFVPCTLARRILRIIELSFHCVATLPRELPCTLDSAADLTELLTSLTLAAP